MIVFKPPRVYDTTHLKTREVGDHRRALDVAWKLRGGSPLMQDFFSSMEYWHKMGALDQADFRRLMELHSNIPGGKTLKLRAVMPPAVAALMLHKYPDMLKDRKEFERMLREHPEYSAPTEA